MTHSADVDYDMLAAVYEARRTTLPPIFPCSYKGSSARDEIELQALAAVESAMPHPCPCWTDEVAA
jgi:hypothetical protein